MLRRKLLLFVTTALLLVVGLTGAGKPAGSLQDPAPEYGPPKGTLVIVGGGSTDGTTIMEKFIELGGGPDGKFVIVPTAGGNRNADGTLIAYTEERSIAPWLRRGLKNVKMLHTHDPKVADTEAFASVLRDATAVWFDGGRQWNIVDSYAGTLTYREFHKVLERGGVIGGSSAGATIQGDYLVRGDTSGPNIVMTEEKNHQKGFDFLRKVAIDQHINTRLRWDDIIPVVKKYPNLLGIGLSEGTAIVVKGDRFEVMGKWKVAVHDNTRLYQPWEKPYYVLGAGDVYNMKTRKIEKFADGTTPAARRGGGGERRTTGSGEQVMKRVIGIAIALALSSIVWESTSAAPAGTRLLRQPTVSQSQVAFTYANNVWVAERAGGLARRITSFQGATTNPKFSPDGKWIAFSAEYSGNVDVYLVPSEGGEPKRLTWHPGGDQVQGWTPDGKAILFASSRSTWAPSGAPRFWTVPIEGGIESPLPLPRGFQGKISPDGGHIAYRMNTSWDDERRNYRGGQNRPIWIVDLKSFDLISPPWTDSKDVDPVWVGDTVFFISDRDGVANVWAFESKSKKLRQVTKFTDFDVKSMDAGAGTLVIEQAGYIHEVDPGNGKMKQIAITATGDFPWMMPRWEDVSSRISNIAISPTGKRALVEARGEIFTIPVEKGDVRNLTQSSGAAERDPAWSPDGKYISYFSDKTGEYRLVLEEPDGLSPPKEITLPKPTHYYTASWSPDSKKLMYSDTNVNVWVLDIASGQAKSVGRDEWMVPERTLNPVWSPDSKWVAYAGRLRSLHHAIFVANAETGESKQLTDGLADAVWPAWDASGKYLWFLASTDFGLGSQWLDMTSYDHSETFALYFAILKKGEPTPLLPESDEDPGISAGGRGGRAGGAAGAAGATDETGGQAAPRPASGPVTVQIDFDNIGQRILAVPGVPARDYSRLRAGAAGSVFYIETPAGGGATTLQRYRFSDRRAAPFMTGVTDYVISADTHKMLYRGAGGGGGGRGGGAAAAAPAGPPLFIVDADRAVPQAGVGRLSATLRMYLEPKEEFKQIFREGWRNQRDYLYVPNMQGADWTKMEEMYGQILPYVNHRADLNYLLDNMGAEIAIGHSYVRGGDMPEVPAGTGGLLGADFAIENGRYKITRIYDTEAWNPELRAPLQAPGIEVNVGDFILAINGNELRAPDSIHRLLDGTSNRQTRLTLNNRPVMEGARQVTVLPIASEQALRTRAWVEENRRLVDRLSKGQLAYVYVPNTGQPGYSSFNRYYFSQQEKLGAIIDERYNGGGSAADYIIDVLQRDFDGYFNNVAGDRMPFTSPSAGIWGPKVMVINEMAGSGGDLMPYMFRYRKLGTLVGKRTWGGLVHTADTPGFIDGGSMIAPRGGFFTRDGKWAVENEGVGPDIDVENWPKDVIAGHDPQLERAVEEALRLLKEKPVDRMMKEPAPPLWGVRKGGGE